MDIENKLIDAIEAVVNNAIEKATFDKTIQGVVSKCEDPTIGKYTIKYQDSSFYAYSTSSEVKYKNGVSVYILVPGNDMSQDKTILGAVEKLGADYAVTAEGDEAYDTIGVNCINSKDTIELCSYNKDGQVKILYDKENNINLIKLDTVAAQKYITQSSSIICGAVVKTDLPTEQRLKGNYGVVYELVFEDNATGAMVKKNYIMDVNQMTGNPYKVLKPTRQYGIFTIDGINFKYVNRIYAFAYDFPNKADNKKNDLFLSSIELCGATRLSDDILKSTIITFNTPDGDYFSADAALNSQLRVLAKVRVKGKVIDTSSQLLDYY